MSMVIISHRGYWKTAGEKNRRVAFERSFALGYGTETDIRDRNGDLVIAHDMARAEDMTLDEFFEIYKQYDDSLPLALNIKADGLVGKLKDYLSKYNVKNYYLFDMSVPDQLVCLNAGAVCYTRVSEIEPQPSLYDRASGIWLDAFFSDWYGANVVAPFLRDGKKVTLVSPELHKRPHQAQWQRIKDAGLHKDAGLSLCTDLPEEATSFFFAD